MIKIIKQPKPVELSDEKQLVYLKSTDKKVWNKRYIIEGLRQSSHNKCCYCECSLDAVGQHMAVDHYFPKSLYPDLAMDWDNMLPACARCNSHKASHDTGKEPIVNPSKTDPKDYLILRDYKLYPKNEIGKTTIDVLQLNDVRYARDRFKIGQKVSETVESLLDSALYMNKTGEWNPRLTTYVKRLIREGLPQVEYSATAATTLLRNSDFAELIRILRPTRLWDDELEKKHAIIQQNALAGIRHQASAKLSSLSTASASGVRARQTQPDTQQSALEIENEKVRNLSDFRVASVLLEDIQGFEYITVDFTESGGNPLMFSLLLGDNSAGKTSFLRCLALGICDDAGSISLLESFRVNFIRRGRRMGKIEVELINSENERYRIVTRLEMINNLERVNKTYTYIPDESNGDEVVETPISTQLFPWEDIFICAYGAGRTLGKPSKEYDSYNIRDAVGLLFNYDQPLRNPELSLRRLITGIRRKTDSDSELKAEQKAMSAFEKLIKEVFMFAENERIELTEKGIEVFNGDDERSPLTSHGDGYKNTAGWLLDMIAWNMTAGRDLDPDKISGIILIDEIEQHLHPKWQRHIIWLLRKNFPKIQFIASTHSPLCASGAENEDDKSFQLLRFHKETNEPIKFKPISPLRGLRADQVLTSEAFDLPTTRNHEIAKKLTRFSDLYLKEKRTAEEENEFSKLRSILDETLPEAAEDAETRLLQKKLKKMLKSLEETNAALEAARDKA